MEPGSPGFLVGNKLYLYMAKKIEVDKTTSRTELDEKLNKLSQKKYH
jgi:hypothetical protein